LRCLTFPFAIARMDALPWPSRWLPVSYGKARAEHAALRLTNSNLCGPDDQVLVQHRAIKAAASIALQFQYKLPIEFKYPAADAGRATDNPAGGKTRSGRPSERRRTRRQAPNRSTPINTLTLTTCQETSPVSGINRGRPAPQKLPRPAAQDGNNCQLLLRARE